MSGAAEDGPGRPRPPAPGVPGPGPAGIAPASLAAGDVLPARRVADSSPLGWRDVLVRAYRDEAVAGPFATGPTTDLLVCLTLDGRSRIEVRRPRSWASAHYRPGTVAATAPGNVSTLRWRSEDGSRPLTLHVHLAAGLLERVAEELGVPRSPVLLPDALILDDRAAATVGGELAAALRDGSPALRAEHAARLLAARLLHPRHHASRATRRAPGALGPAALQAVLERMREGLRGGAGLDELAAVAAVSPFHLVRSFRLATGTTPHQHLIALRLQEAERLLRTTALPVAEVARRCGYATPSRFSATFRQRTGATPTAYRRAARGGAASGGAG